MKVIWRQNGRDWQIAAGRPYKDEAHLQTFLSQNPTLIPFEDVSKDILPPVVMIREFGLPGSGSSDIIGVDEQGGITIIECKLATNPEVKRKVIGQVLEYAAFLWQKRYVEFDESAQHRLSKPLAQAVRELLDEEAQKEWDAEEFVESVIQTLDSGTFRLVIAVDSVNDELRRTIEYLAQGPSRLAIYALEIGYFTNEQGEILVPHLHGFEPKVPPPPRPHQWNEERFFADVAARNLPAQVSQTIRELHEFCDTEASRVYWGVGKQLGSFTFRHTKGTRNYSLFSIYSSGNIAINFESLKDKASLDAVSSFWKELQGVGGFRKMHVTDDFKCCPSAKIDEVFQAPADMETFQQIVLRFRDQIASA